MLPRLFCNKMETEDVMVLRNGAWEGWVKWLRRTARSKDGELPLPSLVKKEAKLPSELGLLRK